MYSINEEENQLMGAFDDGYNNNGLIEAMNNDWYSGYGGYDMEGTPSSRDLRYIESFRSKARGALQKEAYNLYGRPTSVTMQRESMFRGPEQMDSTYNFRSHNAGTLEQMSGARRLKAISKYDEFYQ